MQAFLDANIFVYASGDDERPKRACLSVIEFAEASGGAFVTSAEVMQEVFNVALPRNQPGRVAQVLRLIVFAAADKVEPVYGSDVVAAAQLAAGNASLQARDLVHLAVMNRLGLRRSSRPTARLVGCRGSPASTRSNSIHGARLYSRRGRSCCRSQAAFFRKRFVTDFTRISRRGGLALGSAGYT